MKPPPSKDHIKLVVDRAIARSQGDLAQSEPEPKELLTSVLSEVEIEAEIRRLGALPETVYETERITAANKLGMRAGVLDRLVRNERPKKDELQGSSIILIERSAAAEPVDGAALLEALVEMIGKYVVLESADADAVALWIVASYAFDEFFIFPRLRLKSATKQCGKSTLLDVIESLVNKPLTVSNVTGPALVRLIAAQRPTMLLDEADRYMRASEDLISIVNAGHKRNGVITRCVGDDQEVRVFSAWSPMVIAAIRELPGTVEDRSITITMRRKTKDQAVHRFRTDRPPAEFAELAAKACRWAADHAVTLGNADPEMPPAIGNRAADNWRPLLAVADAVGWGERARHLAVEHVDDDEEIRVRLLRDIQAVFTEGALHSADLVERLNAIEDSPWPEFQRGRPLSQSKLAALLHDFGIRPVQVKIGHLNRRGFSLEQFAGAFAAYLAPRFPVQGATSATAREIQEKSTEDPLPLEVLPTSGDPLPGPSSTSAMTGSGCEGSTSQAENINKNKSVAPVAVDIRDLERVGATPCAQCGAADGDVYLFDGVLLHRACQSYRNLDLPGFLDRRSG